MSSDRINGRWVGSWWEFPCTRCHAICQTAHPPQQRDAQCSACRLVIAMGSATLSLSDLIADRDRWEKRALEAEKQNSDLLDELAQARGAA